MRKAASGPPITRGVIETALQNYFARGGKVTVLPPQSHTNRTIIGGDIWAAYESSDDSWLV